MGTTTDAARTVPAAALTPAEVAATKALVSGGGIPWANRVAPATAGNGALMWADFGGGLSPVLMRSDGTNWRVTAPSLVASNTTILSGINATGEQYLGNLAVPGGLLFPGAVIEWQQGFARSDGTDATTQTTQRIGPLGTTSDPAPVLMAQTALTGTTRTGGVSSILRVTSSNTLQRRGNAGLVNGTFSSSASSVAFGTASAAQNLANPIYFGASVTLAAATGTTLPQITGQFIWMLPS